MEKTDVRWVTWQTLCGDLPKRPVFASTIEQHKALIESVVQRRASWPDVCAEHAHSHEPGKVSE